MIRFDFLEVDRKFKIKPVLKNLLAEIPKDCKKTLGAINVIFTNNTNVLKINKAYLNHHYFTDVITFDEKRKNSLSGDIFISIEQVRINANEYNVPFVDELLRVIIHGILHLAGYKDDTSDEKLFMRKVEDIYLCRFKEVVTIEESET